MERKLAEKIAAYRSNYFELLPLKNRMMESDNHFTLAAASAHTLQKKLITQTFLNADSSFLLRLVETEKESLLYVFTRDPLADHSLKLTFFPSLQEYLVRDIGKAIVLDFPNEIEKVTIELV